MRKKAVIGTQIPLSEHNRFSECKEKFARKSSPFYENEGKPDSSEGGKKQ